MVDAEKAISKRNASPFNAKTKLNGNADNKSSRLKYNNTVMNRDIDAALETYSLTNIKYKVDQSPNRQQISREEDQREAIREKYFQDKLFDHSPNYQFMKEIDRIMDRKFERLGRKRPKL